MTSHPAAPTRWRRTLGLLIFLAGCLLLLNGLLA